MTSAHARSAGTGLIMGLFISGLNLFCNSIQAGFNTGQPSCTDAVRLFVSQMGRFVRGYIIKVSGGKIGNKAVSVAYQSR